MINFHHRNFQASNFICFDFNELALRSVDQSGPVIDKEDDSKWI